MRPIKLINKSLSGSRIFPRSRSIVPSPFAANSPIWDVHEQTRDLKGPTLTNRPETLTCRPETLTHPPETNSCVDHELGLDSSDGRRERLGTKKVMANCTGGDFFQLPWIAESFHSFAHVNFYFHNVSSVFVPTLQDYQQVGQY